MKEKVTAENKRFMIAKKEKERKIGKKSPRRKNACVVTAASAFGGGKKDIFQQFDLVQFNLGGWPKERLDKKASIF